MTKLVIRKQWLRGQDYNSYQMFIFDGDKLATMNLDATSDECVDVTKKAIEAGFHLNAENTFRDEGIISIMTWQ